MLDSENLTQNAVIAWAIGSHWLSFSARETKTKQKSVRESTTLTAPEDNRVEKQIAFKFSGQVMAFVSIGATPVAHFPTSVQSFFSGGKNLDSRFLFTITYLKLIRFNLVKIDFKFGSL